MNKTPIYFDSTIALFDVMRAAASIGCTLKRDRARNALCVVRNSAAATPAGGDVIDLFQVPAFLRRQGE